MLAALALALSATALPLGDGHVSSSPRAGYVDSCVTSFNAMGGAQAAGPWIDEQHGTWDSAAKLHVRGAVRWPEASFTTTAAGTRRRVVFNDLPVGHTTGTFPIASDDPAFAYDRNPNRIARQSLSWSLPRAPERARRASCTPLGPIGVLTDGVVLYNALDAEGRDAAAHEVLDSCDGHPERSGAYHHHTVPSCIVAKATGSSTLAGYALDGFGVFIDRKADGSLLTNADLDACHGRTSTVTWDGQQVSMYHYVATLEYPYTVGCYRGTPSTVPR